jgi:hypothetical protein
MYASPDAVPRYVAYSGFSENAVRRTMQEFMPKESLQMDEIKGVSESMADAKRSAFDPAAQISLFRKLKLASCARGVSAVGWVEFLRNPSSFVPTD